MESDSVHSGSDPAADGLGPRRARPDMRRIQLAHEPALRLGPLSIEPPVRRIAHADGREEIVEPRVMQVLVALLRAPGSILSREDLIECCWDGRIVGDDAINRVMSRLRRTSEGLGAGIFRIETVTKVGYRLALAVNIAPPPTLIGRRMTRASLAPSRSRLLGYLAAVLAVAVLAIGAYILTRPAAPVEPASIAVLPFRNLAPGDDYFAEGVAEEILGLLSEEPGLQVVGRTSTAMLGREVSFAEARERLGVTHLLEGSVRVQGPRIRVHVRLVRTADGMQVWGEQFDRPLSDVFAVQDEVAAGVAARLRRTLQASAPLERRSPRTSTQVYDLYLAANNKANELTYPSLIEAQRLLLRAVAIDPNYAPAWTRLSMYMFGSHGGAPDWPTKREQALSYVRRALALDPNLSEAHHWLGYLAGIEREDPERALAGVRRSLALDQQSYGVWWTAGITFMELCQPRQAENAWRRWTAVEPLLPPNPLVYGLAYGGRYRDAEAAARGFLSRSRNPRYAARFSALIAEARGDLSQAVVHEMRGVPSDARAQGLNLAYYFRSLGMTDRAVAALPADLRNTVGAYWRGDYRTAAAQLPRLRGVRWHQSRTFAIAKATVRAGRHRPLLELFDERFGSIEAFDRRMRCRLPFHAAPIVIALRHEGRAEEADRLLALAEARHSEAVQAGYNRAVYEGAHAELLMLGGRRDAALASLELAASRGGAGSAEARYPILDLAEPVFDPVRNHLRFRAIQQRVEAWQARERRELAQAGIRL